MECSLERREGRVCGCRSVQGLESSGGPQAPVQLEGLVR